MDENYCNFQAMEDFFNYYGLDWLGMALSLWAVYMLGNKNRYGFVVFAVANMLWVFLGMAWMDSLGIAVGNFVFLVMNLRGYWTWSKEEVASS